MRDASAVTVFIVAIALLIVGLASIARDRGHDADIYRQAVALSALYARVDSLEVLAKEVE